MDVLPHAGQHSDRRASDAPLCMTCGIQMQRAGSCYVCTDCGTTSGCS
jgi:ribonucleoside-diphosphate reductase alpha chain